MVHPVFRMINPVREYAWGSTHAFSELFGWPPSATPQAEIWMGTHSGAPSEVQLESRDATMPLREVLRSELPFLLKILAADKPLSIQAHPTQAAARAGFEAENSAGIELTAAQRNYKDPHHKPELIVAITEFSALCGFRPYAEAAADLRALSDALKKDYPGLKVLLQHVESQNYDAALEWVLRSGAPEAGAVAAALGEAAADGVLTDVGLNAALVDTLQRTTAAFPADPGVLVATLLNRIDLRPGEGLFLPAGNLHAYLSGVGVEVMAASDNVLRGGLTSKHIDVPELLAVVQPEVLPLPYCEPVSTQSGVLNYLPPVEEFQLTRIDFPAAGSAHTLSLQAAAVAICTAGTAHARAAEDTRTLTLAAGESVFIDSGEQITFSSDQEAQIFIAIAQGSPARGDA